MSKEELIEYLQNNLKVEIDYSPGNAWSYPIIKIITSLEDVEINISEAKLYL